MTRRRGISLIEALVALFIAALGMISLLTLFPLGALQMGQALKDSRCAQAAQEADNLMRWYWAKYETNSNSYLQLALDRGDPITAALGPTTNGVPQPLTGQETLPSYPVLVDPFGKLTNWPTPATAPTPPSVLQKNCVALMPSFPRMSVYPYAGSPTVAVGEPLPRRSDLFRFAMLQDDLTFSDTKRGTPGAVDSASTPVERGGRYTWAWLLQRPNNSRRGLINMSVVVFDQRAPLYANQTTEVRYDNMQYTPGFTSVRVVYPLTQPRPPITKGRWVLDATPVAYTPTEQIGVRHANFYRVASVYDELPGQIRLELETPIRRNDGGSSIYSAGTMIILNGVAEVFERPPLVTGGN